MKPIEVNIPQPVAKPRIAPLLKRLTPLGWVAVVVIGVFLCAAGALLVRTIYNNSLTFDDIPRPTPFTPTPPTPTPTSLYPTATPTPDGWTTQTHPATGEQYLSPSPQDAVAISAVADAVLAPQLLITDADPSAAFEEYDRDAAIAASTDFVATEDWELIDWSRHPVELIDPQHWLDTSPIVCTSHRRCLVARTKTGPTIAVFNYDELCARFSYPVPCLVQPPQLGEDPAPYRAYLVIVELQEDGIWQATDYDMQELPVPPTSF